MPGLHGSIHIGIESSRKRQYQLEPMDSDGRLHSGNVSMDSASVAIKIIDRKMYILEQPLIFSR